MQYILLFATVIKYIAPPTFNHMMYNISVFLLVQAKIKCTLAAPLYILLLAGTSKKSDNLYIIYSKVYIVREKKQYSMEGMIGHTVVELMIGL